MGVIVNLIIRWSLVRVQPAPTIENRKSGHMSGVCRVGASVRNQWDEAAG